MTTPPKDAGAVMRLLDQPLSDADLAEGSEYAARPARPRSGGSEGVLLFRLDGELLAIPAILLRRTTPYARPSPVPHRTTGLLRGLCNIRGELVLCADLRRLLGVAPSADQVMKEGQSDPRRMVVIGTAAEPWVFEVDSLVGVERIDTGTLRPAPLTVEHAINAYVLGLTEIGGKPVTELDGERILTGFKAGLS